VQQQDGRAVFWPGLAVENLYPVYRPDLVVHHGIRRLLAHGHLLRIAVGTVDELGIPSRWRFRRSMPAPAFVGAVWCHPSRSLAKTIDYPTLGSAGPSCMGERKGSQRAWEFSFRSLPHSETSADPGRSQQIVEDGPGRRTMGHATSRRTLSALDVGAQKNVRANCNLGMARSHIAAILGG
jgi:hypothetical protein